MKRMLFNATHSEELRVAIVDGQKLIDIDIESAGRESRKSNIYKGVVTRVEPSLEACFVNYGEERHGFLPFKEISRSFFKPDIEAAKARIQDAISEGQELIVQVEKEERGNKGAALTTFVSLAGRYLVLMPNNPRGGGVSRRVEGEDRQELRETMDKLEIPPGMSMIARTAGIGRSVEELQWDLNYLMQLWRAVDSAAKSAAGAFLIYQESSLVIRAIRDYFTADIGEILVDTDDIFDQASQFMGHVMPDSVQRVKRYRDNTPLFSRFQIEHQIETAYSRIVPLPSGGAVVIDHTEALVAIDVNSARATRGSDIEETAFRTNMEAAEEAARQMRLRDLGGLIVIDFIDMENTRNQREVEQCLKDSLQVDRARVQTGKISRFGLMELSRQRLRPALNEGTHITCPRCNGTGVIRDIESSALHVLRVIQEESMKENSAAVHAQVPVEVATYLLNEKRAEIAKLEARLKVDIVLIPNKFIETPHYKLDRLKHDDDRLASYRMSYNLADTPDEENTYLESKFATPASKQEAVVKGIRPDQPAPAPVQRPAPAGGEAAQATTVAPPSPATQPGLFGMILNLFRKGAANESTLKTGAQPAVGDEIETKAAAGRSSRSSHVSGADSASARGARTGGSGARRDAGRSDGGRGDKRRERGGEARRNDRGDRGAERSAERGERPDRNADRGADRVAERGVEKGPDRGAERGPDRGVQRNADRGADRGAESTAERAERADRGERPDRGERADRAERPERGDRGGRGRDRPPREESGRGRGAGSLNGEAVDQRDASVASAEGLVEAPAERPGRAPRRRNERSGDQQGGEQSSGAVEEAQADVAVSLASRPAYPMGAIGAAGDESDHDRIVGSGEDRNGLLDGEVPSVDTAALDPERRGRSRRRRGRRDRGDDSGAVPASEQRSQEQTDSLREPETSSFREPESVSARGPEGLSGHGPEASSVNAEDPVSTALAQPSDVVQAADPAVGQSNPTGDLFPRAIDTEVSSSEQAPQALPAPAASTASSATPSTQTREDAQQVALGAREEVREAAARLVVPDERERGPAHAAESAPPDARAPAARIVAAPLEAEELTSVIASAGLEWVQTTRSAQDAADDEIAPAAATPRRQRKPKMPMVAEPLQQVETQPGDAPDQ